MTPHGSPGEVNIAPADGPDQNPPVQTGNGNCRLGAGTQPAYDAIRARVSFMESDRPLMTDINLIADLVRSNELLAGVESAVPIGIL
jgi:hypothetical protein